MQQLNKQRGITLISLMIGTVLSMLTILAMLALYKNLIQVAVIASQDANHDGGLASALLTAQMELASAGFALNEDPDTLIHLPNSAAAILWRYKNLDTAKVSCSGLLLRTHPAKKEHARTLTLLHKADCSIALNLLAVAESDTALKASWGTEPGAITNLAVLNPSTELTFTEDSTTCTNYGITHGLEHRQITIKASNSSSVDALETIYRVCLSNIPGSTGGNNNEAS